MSKDFDPEGAAYAGYENEYSSQRSADPVPWNREYRRTETFSHRKVERERGVEPPTFSLGNGGHPSILRPRININDLCTLGIL